VPLHRPPADWDDFSRSTAHSAQDLQQRWSAVVDDLTRPYDRGLFYNATNDTSPGSPAEPPGITWNAFPLALQKLFSAAPPPQALASATRFADTLRPLPVVRSDTGEQVNGFFQRRQDEYCEWYAERTAGQISRITFTCENPEYWEFLFGQDPDLVVKLYNELLGRTDVRRDDLAWPWPVTVDDAVKQYAQGAYNRYNKWNTQFGAIHLTHSANTLGAEIDLAAKATHSWPVSLGQADDAQRLTCCSGWGNPNRSSDPNIGKGVFDIAGTGVAVTIAEPVGLYMSPLSLAGRLRAPDGTDIGPVAVQVGRGSPDKAKVLRLDIVTPRGVAYSLSDCSLDGVGLKSGGQIARLITMVVFGAGKQIPGRQRIPEQTCENFCCSHPKAPDYTVPFENKPGQPQCQNMPITEFPPIPATSAPSPMAADLPLAGGVEAVMMHSALGPLASEFRAKIRKHRPTRLAW
jgi:hypothetical protein